MNPLPETTHNTPEHTPPSVPRTTHETAASVPISGRPQAASPRKSSLPLIIGGILLGVVGTSLVMPRLRATAPPAATSPAQEAPKAAKTEGRDSGSISLSEEAAKTAGIRVVAARLAPIGEGLTVPGTVELGSNRGAKITPPAPGKVTRLLVNLGDPVRAGQPLAVLDSYEVAQAHAAVHQAEANVQQARSGIQTARAEVSQYQASVQQAQADVEQARTRQASAETVLQRQRKLAQAGAFSQAPLQAAQTELTAAQSELQQAQAELQTRTAQLQRTERLFKEELVSRNDLEVAQLEQKQNQTTVSRAGARVAIAQQALQREQTVYQGGLLNAREVQTAEADVRAAQGEVQKARQGVLRAQQDVRRAQKGQQAAQTTLQGAENQLRAARVNLYALEGNGHTEGGGGLITVLAPIAGVVTERASTTGEAVERTTALLVIENLNTVTVNANVPEADVARIRVGQPVEVTVSAYPKQRFPGTVQSIAGRVNEKTRALAVRCLVENRNGLLRPEMFAKVTLSIGARSSALTVPISALEEDGADRYAYVEANGKFERRKVQVGRTTETQAEITGGLKTGEKVASEGLFVLKSEANKDKLKGDED